MKSESQFGCHQMAAQPTDYCPAIARLIDEHLELKPVMEEILSKTKGMMDSIEKIEQGEMEALRKEVVKFKEDLESHSYKEEAYLFDTLANYIGRNSGPIAVMEYEHQTAKAYIGQYLSKGCSDREALESLKNGIELLKDHFNKEEVVLFPMAENVLSNEEKGEIAEKILK